MEEIMRMPLWAMIPFALMLSAIACGPLFAERWWDKNLNKLLISCVLGIPTAVFLLLNGFGQHLEHQLLFDYLPFIILLLSLYVVTGGIHLSGDIKATPGVNTLFLAIGYVLSSIMGTTGSAMLMIRPVLATNSQREYKVHTILFFIAAVANCGGLLTPLGDPPLFMMYLRGAEFGWFLSLFPEWLVTGLILLGIYYLVDTIYYKKEKPENIKVDMLNQTPIRLHGIINFVYLVGIVLSVAFINSSSIPAMADENASVFYKYLREIVLLLLSALSLCTTKRETRFTKNHFSWNPILEVAVVFLGIFVTMVPALVYLNDHATSFGLVRPGHFYYITGVLSSFLDNTPTALAFHGVASGMVQQGQLLAEVAGIPELILKAICVGAVFFGAMTYIGNGPNFMVKSVAEENGVKMPGFFGYMLKFSLPILLPVYIVLQLFFF